MFDPTSLRVALGVVVMLAVLHSLGKVRRIWPNSAPVWWGAGLIVTVVSLMLDGLGNGSPVQWLTVPLGNAAGVVAVLCVYNAGASLLDRRPMWVAQGAIVVGALGTAALGEPGRDPWAGALYLLVVLAGVYTAIGVTMASALLYARAHMPEVSRTGRQALGAFAVGALALAVMYLIRTAAFVLHGPESTAFATDQGAGLTALIQTAAVALTTLAIGAAAEERLRADLERRATTDELTAVLARGEVLARIERARDGTPDCTDAIVLCDVDRFKEINDGWGHAAGDRALVAFADAWRSVLGPQDVIGRLGGDEFVVMLHDVDEAGAVARVREASCRLASEDCASGRPAPSVSHGIAMLAGDTVPTVAIGRADMALYEAKAAGGGAIHVAHRSEPAREQ
ncbi:GGDEF domain-containing protein [Demequina mangrovi]|uniref:Diguanylate cyclase (GGDEF) domain-containing protein n=1 Tax=Demequina mangrovi TaxID=1043493 RepID=A0A1H6TNF4_9MICO|nr:GGDEF domain-containing protein [Demequina mangrovi]SEI81619.1 diguanylate cyclase (GGDEF) domain-containing protein [Demequina mangrovi]